VEQQQQQRQLPKEKRIIQEKSTDLQKELNVGIVSRNLLQDEVDNYKAGNIINFYTNWFKYTKNYWILDIVKNGLSLDFLEIPKQNNINQMFLSKEEEQIIDTEIIKLLNKGVIEQTQTESGEYISSLFTRPKKDGSKRMILNLKGLNSYIEYNHFKMESIQNVIDSIEEGSYMASVDLKDAFFSVPINRDHQKYLKFRHKDKLYKFIAMPNGYGPAMRVFTKILKVLFSFLRKNRNISVVYVDDT